MLTKFALGALLVLGIAFPAHAATPVSSTADANAHHGPCSKCGLHEICLPAGLDLLDVQRLEHIVHRKRPLKRGEYSRCVASPWPLKLEL